MTDDALWQRLRHGDEEALREAFGRHSDTVYNVAFRNEARNQVRSRTRVLRLIHRARRTLATTEVAALLREED